jgi:hypothetical protein
MRHTQYSCTAVPSMWLRFRDGTAGEVDLASRLTGEIFQPLRDPQYFKTFTVHPEFGYWLPSFWRSSVNQLSTTMSGAVTVDGGVMPFAMMNRPSGATS